MRVVLLGPPGAGKGTQAERLCAARRWVHLSTGDLLRAAVAAGSALGKQARDFMDRGALVPDALVLSLVEERLAATADAAGHLFDGFPRNAAQAEALDAVVGSQPIERVVHLHVDDEVLVARLLGRGRKDDQEDVIRHRLEVYRAETSPLIALYEERGILVHVDAAGSMEQVASRIGTALGTSPSSRASERSAPAQRAAGTRPTSQRGAAPRGNARGNGTGA